MKNVSISTNTIHTTKHQVLRSPKLKDTNEIFSVVKLPQFPEQLPLKEMDTVYAIKHGGAGCKKIGQPTRDFRG